MVFFQLKNKCRAQPTATAQTLVTEALREVVPEGHRMQKHFKPDNSNLIRAAQRHKTEELPKNPTSPDFVLDLQWIKERAGNLDVITDICGEERIIIFSNDYLLKLFSTRKLVFVDGTFRIRPAVFACASGQVFTMHGYVHLEDGNSKLVPLIYVLMTRRRQSSYEAVFRALNSALADRDLMLQSEMFLADFEPAVWNAAKEVFGVDMHGCAFHWSQSFQRQAAKVGLWDAVKDDADMNMNMLRLQHFQFLPPNHIVRALSKLELLYSADMGDTHPVRHMILYMKKTWVTSNTHPPSSWSQFGAIIRTNNGVESFHRKINKIIGIRPRLYLFISSIESNAKTNMEEISSEDFCRDVRAGQIQRDLAIERAQALYREKSMTPKDYLDKIVRIYKPKRV